MIRLLMARPTTPAGEQLLAALDEQQRFAVRTHGDDVAVEVWGAADADEGWRLVDGFLSRLAQDWERYLIVRRDP